MVGRSLEWGVREMGKRMSGEIRTGDRVGEMPLLFCLITYKLFVERMVCSWDLEVVERIKIQKDPGLEIYSTYKCNRSRCDTCVQYFSCLLYYFLLLSVRIQRDFES